MSEDSLLGTLLDEYRLEALLGHGGMARVYRALDTGLNRYVAVKIIDTPHRGDAEYVKRFKIEAQAIARLDHPQVVRLFRYGEVNGILYMAMQFIEGVDLGFLFESYRLDGEYIPSMDALRLVKEISQALDYVHAHGIIHRDVKPSNIMLTRDEGRAILTDFGLALRAEVGTRGEIFGSPQYIAPEQAVSSAKSVPQSDLYSLGVILYEMFTGVLPFNSAGMMDIAIQQISSPPPPPRSIRPDLSPEVEAVILKALEKKPEYRYQTGRELALALERALYKQPPPTLPANRSIPERVTIGFAANPMAALPPIQASVTPPQPVVETYADTVPPPMEAYRQLPGSEPASVSTPIFPAEKSDPVQDPPNPPIQTPKKAGKYPLPWILGGAAALVGLCLLTCLVIGGLVFLLRGRNPVVGLLQGTPTPTIASPNTSIPANLSTSTPPASENYRLKFWHCANEECLVVENTGGESIPLTGLTFKGKDSSLSAGDWGVPSLEPGQCVEAVNGPKWVGKMPDGVTCQIEGQTLLRGGKQQFWSKGFTIYYQGKKVAECMNVGDWCEILVRR